MTNWPDRTRKEWVVPGVVDLKAEEMGLKRLLQMGSILPIPQTGFATADEKIKTARQEVIAGPLSSMLAAFQDDWRDDARWTKFIRGSSR